MTSPLGDAVDPDALAMLRPDTRIVDAARVTELPRSELAPGVTNVGLWTEGRSNAGVLYLRPRARLAEHTHRRHVHHVWVVEGSIHTLGRDLARGSYAFVPPEQPHELTAGSDGASVFYLYLEVTGAH